MAKKYVPSGYQIINITINESSSIVDSEDKDILSDILKNQVEKDFSQKEIKPILLRIYDKANDYTTIGFATFDGVGIGLSVSVLDEQSFSIRHYYFVLNNVGKLIHRFTEIE